MTLPLDLTDPTGGCFPDPPAGHDGPGRQLNSAAAVADTDLGTAGSTTTAGPVLSFIAHGTPAPQGSKSAFVNRHTGRASVVESSKKVKPWRQDVKAAAEHAVERAPATFPLAGPLRAVVIFTVKKPTSAPKRRRTWPATRPDVDKYARAVLDALRDGGVYGDDGQVVELETAKRYPLEGVDALNYPGVLVRVYTVTGDEA